MKSIKNFWKKGSKVQLILQLFAKPSACPGGATGRSMVRSIIKGSALPADLQNMIFEKNEKRNNKK